MPDLPETLTNSERRREDGDVLVGACAVCGRDADPDTELLVVVLGKPMCAACAEDAE